MDPAKGGIKFDGGKTQWHLLPFEAVEGAVKVLMHGAAKYAAYNWANGMPYTRVLDATMRHLHAIYQGEDKDPDSGLDHVDHALCELIFLKYYMLHGVGEDDRFKRGSQVAARARLTELVTKLLTPKQARMPKDTLDTCTIRKSYDDDEAREDLDPDWERDHWGV